MGRIEIDLFTTLDLVAQAPGGPDEDTEDGFAFGIASGQPQASTLELTDRVDRALDDLAGSLPQGMSLYRKGFRQADFIRVALDNVGAVLRDGAILVAIVLTLFLMSWRTTAISACVCPASKRSVLSNGPRARLSSARSVRTRRGYRS